MIHHQLINGPYAEDTGTFPVLGERRNRLTGFKSGIFSVSDGKLFLRHQAFLPDLTPLATEKVQQPHLIPSAGFLQSVPQHRTYWTVDIDLCLRRSYMAVTGLRPAG